MRNSKQVIEGVQALRNAFDRSFTVPEQMEKPPRTAYVILRMAERVVALRTADALGVMANVPLTPIPSKKAALMGTAKVRGAVAPVYDLEKLLQGKPLVWDKVLLPWVVALRHSSGPVAVACSEVIGLQWVEDWHLEGGSLELEEGAISVLDVPSLPI